MQTLTITGQNEFDEIVIKKDYVSVRKKREVRTEEKDHSESITRQVDCYYATTITGFEMGITKEAYSMIKAILQSPNLPPSIDGGIDHSVPALKPRIITGCA